MRYGWGLAAAAVALGLAGCAPRQQHTVMGGRTAPGQVRAAMVTDTGGIDDQSFNAGAWAGLKRAETELGIPKPRYVESKEQSDYVTNLSTLAEQGNDIVFAVGFLMEDALKQVAPKYPKVKFAIIDGTAPNLPNCASLKFREEEGSFLAGYLAGKMSKTGAVGFIGGMEVPLIKKFEIGYTAGAMTANPKIRVISKYVGNWTDLAKGKDLAQSEYRDGADIIFAAAGKPGLAVMDAANEKGPGFYAIGVDADQDYIHPGRVLTSMMKDVNNAVFDTVKQVKEGRWQAGDHVFGIKEGGIHLSEMKYTKKDVPPDVLAKINTLSQQIADGKLKVPTTEVELQNFTAPKL